jgi:hypothetical protein
MPSFTIKVPNFDDGEDLGEYEADYLPRVGDPFVLWHPRVCPKKDQAFCGVVSGVTHEAVAKGHPYYNAGIGAAFVETVVWLTEELAAPTLYCDCTEEERARWSVGLDGKCESCGQARSP